MEDPTRREVVREEPVAQPAAARPAGAPVRRETVASGYSFRAVHLIWLATGVVDALIAIRFLLKALGASQSSSFVSFMYAITDPMLAPFRGIFPTAAANRSVIEPAAIVAFVVYLLIGWGLVTLVRIVTTPRGTRVVD